MPVLLKLRFSEGRKFEEILTKLSERFLQISLAYSEYINFNLDQKLLKIVKKSTTFSNFYPTGPKTYLSWIELTANDEFELKFPKLSQAELKGCRVERFPIRANFGHFNFRVETELSWQYMSTSSKLLALIKNYNKISQFCAFFIIITNSNQFHVYL